MASAGSSLGQQLRSGECVTANEAVPLRPIRPAPLPALSRSPPYWDNPQKPVPLPKQPLRLPRPNGPKRAVDKLGRPAVLGSALLMAANSDRNFQLLQTTPDRPSKKSRPGPKPVGGSLTRRKWFEEFAFEKPCGQDQYAPVAIITQDVLALVRVALSL